MRKLREQRKERGGRVTDEEKRAAQKKYFRLRYEAKKEEYKERSRQRYHANAKAILESRKAYRKKYNQEHRASLNESRKRWRAANPEAVKEENRRHRQEHAEKRREYDRKYKQANTERLRQARKAYYKKRDEVRKILDRAYKRQQYWKDIEATRKRQRVDARATSHTRNKYFVRYRKLNRDRVATWGRNREARKRQAVGKHTVDEVRALWIRHKKKCAVPGCEHPIAASGPNKYHVDHIRALANGGSNDISNLQILCRQHNIEKSARDEYKWAQEHGLLFPK